jgi:hypothetical protein
MNGGTPMSMAALLLSILDNRFGVGSSRER